MDKVPKKNVMCFDLERWVEVGHQSYAFLPLIYVANGLVVSQVNTLQCEFECSFPRYACIITASKHNGD